MAVIGSATLNIVPKVEGGLSKYINGEISKANLSAVGSGAGEDFTSGLTNGAAFGIWSNLASRAIDTVVGSLGSAASRVDTLNNYPRIMQTLGVETEDANRSIQTMSSELSNVPTRLDDMANVVQGVFAASSKYGTSLDTVTDAGLALNSMLLAGGQNQQAVNSAMEQFRQMVAKGKPDMQDWRSLLSAAPGQMNQLAQEMLGATATADDLYAALGGGKEDEYEGAFERGSIDMGEFITRLAEMKDTFSSAAEEAQGGISTSLANMQNAVTRGVAGILDAIGQENIAGAIGDIKGMINDAFGGVQGVMQNAAPIITDIWKNLSPAIPVVAGVATAFGSLHAGIGAITGIGGGAISLFSNLSEKLLDFRTSTGAAQKMTALLGESFNPVALGVGAAAIGIGALAYSAYDAWKKETDFKNGLDGVSSSTDLFKSALAGGTSGLDDMGGGFEHAHANVENLTEAMQDYNSKAESIRQSTQENIGALSRYQAAVDEAAQVIADGGELSESQTMRLKEALDEINRLAGTDYTVDQFTKEREHVQELCGEIDQLIAKKKQEARQSAISDMYTESYSLQTKAATELNRALMDQADAQRTFEETKKHFLQAGYDEAYATNQAHMASRIVEANKAVEDARRVYDEATEAVEMYDGMLDNAAEASENLNSKVAQWIDSNALAGAAVQESSMDLSSLVAALEGAGVSTEQLEAIGADNFASLASKCNGDVGSMVAALQLYNSTGLVEKDGAVYVDDTVLVDAQGKLYTWNGTDLVDKDGHVAADGTQLMDVYGNVVTWNNTNAKDIIANVRNTSNPIPGLIDWLDRLKARDGMTVNTRVTNTTEERRVYTTIHDPDAHTATGGHIVPRHAAGYIAAGPTRTNWGWVGEDGIEAVYNNADGSSDVYPLNNPRYLDYADPLGQRIAASVMGALGDTALGSTYVIERLTYLPGSEVSRHVDAIFAEAMRKARM